MDFSKEKIRVMCEKLDELRTIHLADIEGLEYAPCEYKTSNRPDADLEWKPFEKHQQLWGKDSHFWLRTKLVTPEKNEGKRLLLEISTGKEGEWDACNPQCTIFLNGETVQAMDTNHTTLDLEYGTEYDLLVYFYVGMIDTRVNFRPCLKLLDEKINKLYYDLLVPYNAICCLDEKSYDYINSVKVLDEALINLDLRNFYSKEFYESIDKTIDFLDREFYNGICGNSEAVVNVIGHTHIDVAWRWTLAQTVEKTQRSFSTVINLMKRYPEYMFMSSQPQLYKYLKETDPELYEKVKERIAEGRWQPEGAMWLEADTNLASGESLVRQILFGKRFMKEEFGKDNTILWLPDVFGYSAALPQILKKSGVDKFFTTKLFWSETNLFPHNTFIWQGIDGSEVFTSMCRDYSKKLNPTELLAAWEEYQDKKYTSNVISTFGHGDGGGGPTEEMLENYERLKKGLPGMPKAQMMMPTETYEIIEKEFFETADKIKSMPKWVGELYLEMHRGTYTTLGKNKKFNRKSELLYQSLEAASAAANKLLGFSYPQDKINENWELILLNQFHDIIPGSSILEVYEDSDVHYKKILDEGSDMYCNALSEIKGNVKTDGGIFVYNPNSFAVSGVTKVDGEYVYAENIPPMGYKVIKDADIGGTVSAANGVIENDLIRVTLNDIGELASVYDKVACREIVRNGYSANALEVFEDYPREYDAWEITSYYAQKKWTIDNLESLEYFSTGLAGGVKIRRKYNNSIIEQTITLYHDSKRIDFDTYVDWHEDHVLLKAAFPVSIHAVKADYEIQFGYIDRPTHKNTSWDEAKFEVCAHKWADISEYGYGVAILNDCKYGYSAEDGMLKISLLKAPTDPNPEADKGEHRFVYSLYPHTGSLQEGNVTKEAYILNKPLVAERIEKQDGSLADTFSFVTCNSDNIIIDTVKKAEDGEDIIIRLYDSFNMKSAPTLDFGVNVKRAFLCDMMENEIEELEVIDNKVSVNAGNFDIITLKICC